VVAGEGIAVAGDSPGEGPVEAVSSSSPQPARAGVSISAAISRAATVDALDLRLMRWARCMVASRGLSAEDMVRPVPAEAASS